MTIYQEFIVRINGKDANLLKNTAVYYRAEEELVSDDCSSTLQDVLESQKEFIKSMCGLLAEENRGHVLSQHVDAHKPPLPFSLFFSYTHTHTHTHTLAHVHKRHNLAVRHHNYSTNCCPACCRPARIMSQHSNDSFELLIMQFLWSSLLAHASHILCATAADWGIFGNNCLSFLVGCFDVWRIPLWCANRVV